MNITLNNIILRPPVLQDGDIFTQLCMDERVTRHFEFIKRDSKEKVMEFLGGMVDSMEHRTSSIHYVIISKEDMRAVGFIGVGLPEETIASAKGRPVMNFGYAIHPSYWGKGYATEALETIIRECFKQFPEIEVIHGECDLENQGSIRVMEKAGMKKVNQYEDDDGSLTIEFMIERPTST